jgi:hypothetical protein
LSDDTLSKISADIAPFGLDHSHYLSAIHRLLALDDKVKAESPAKYLDTIYEVLLRLVETYHQPLLDTPTSQELRQDVESWANAEAPASANIARDILNELPA